MEAEKEFKCWICSSDNVKKLFGDTNFSNLKSADIAVSNDNYGKTLPLYRCSSCSFVFAHPLPENLLDLYQDLKDDEYINSLEPRFKEMKSILNKSLRLLPEAKSLLDIGAGAGLLIKAAKSIGINSKGVEPSNFFVNKAKELFDIDLLPGTVPHKNLQGETFDMVFAVDVLEHVPDPLEFINVLKSYMHKKSLLVIATPDINSIVSKILKQKWWHYRLAHIGYFNKFTIQKAAEKCGLKIMKFKRPVWYLPAEYLLKRLSKYLPIGFLVKIICKFNALSALPVRFNLFDSILVFMEKENEQN